MQNVRDYIPRNVEWVVLLDNGFRVRCKAEYADGAKAAAAKMLGLHIQSPVITKAKVVPSHGVPL